MRLHADSGRKKVSEMIRNSRGFSLVELIVVMAMFVLVIAITSDAFNNILKNAVQQSKTAESNIEGIVGLEIMRKDIASAGFGIPWSFQSAIIYNEVDPDQGAQEKIAAAYNGTPNVTVQTSVPRAIFGGNDIHLASPDINKLIDLSDYLVIRATSIGATEAAQRWSYMNYTGAVKPDADSITPVSWSKDNLRTDDWVTVVRMGLSGKFSKELVVNGGAFTTTYGALDNFTPQESKVTNYIYGVYYKDTDNTPPRMPFNRSDYYVRRPADSEYDKLPKRCAPYTGILYKGNVTHKNGNFTNTELPLLDCVADMQIVYMLETSTNGTITETGDISGLSAQQIREQVKAVQVYLLTHDGGKDPLFTYPNSTIGVGPSADGKSSATGRTFDLEGIIKAGWQNYRWKVYRLIVKPANLGQAIQ
jgi:prepilin-type N-terminal cleavage/methylation domain-containing protein